VARALAIAGRGEPALVQEVIVPSRNPARRAYGLRCWAPSPPASCGAPIAQTFRLDEAPDALGAFASPKLGKLVVTVP